MPLPLLSLRTAIATALLAAAVYGTTASAQVTMPGGSLPTGPSPAPTSVPAPYPSPEEAQTELAAEDAVFDDLGVTHVGNIGVSVGYVRRKNQFSRTHGLSLSGIYRAQYRVRPRLDFTIIPRRDRKLVRDAGRAAVFAATEFGNGGAQLLRLSHPRWSMDAGAELQMFSGVASFTDDVAFDLEIVLTGSVGVYRVAAVNAYACTVDCGSGESTVERLGGQLHFSPSLGAEIRIQLVDGVFLGAAARTRALRTLRDNLYDPDVPSTNRPLQFHFNGAITLTAFIPNT